MSAEQEMEGNEPWLRLVVDVDERGARAIEGGDRRLFVIDGELWRWEQVGCVLCVDSPVGSQSFQAESDPTRFRCLRCGPLVEVAYTTTKTYRVTIGTVVRDGEERVEDSMLFPCSLGKHEIEEFIETLLDEADREEREDL